MNIYDTINTNIEFLSFIIFITGPDKKETIKIIIILNTKRRVIQGKQDRYCTYNVTLSRVRVTVPAVEI